MLSTFPPVFIPDPFLPFDAGFAVREYPGPLPPIRSPNLITSNSNSDFIQSPKPVVSGSGSDSSIPGLDKQNQLQKPIMDDHKQRRKISNRESARRSRMRKQKHLENLRNQVSRLRLENQDLSNRLKFTLYNCHRVRKDNGELQCELTVLQHKLSEMRQVLIFRHSQQQFATSSACPPYNNTVLSE